MWPLLIALLGGGAAGAYFMHRVEGTETQLKTLTAQQKCMELARKGYISPERCLRIGESGLSALADVAEEVGKVVVGAAAAYAVTKLLSGRRS